MPEALLIFLGVSSVSAIIKDGRRALVTNRNRELAQAMAEESLQRHLIFVGRAARVSAARELRRLEMQLGPVAASGGRPRPEVVIRASALRSTGIPAFSADPKIRWRAIQQHHCSFCAGLSAQRERVCGYGYRA
jgi:hypothetical protein